MLGMLIMAAFGFTLFQKGEEFWIEEGPNVKPPEPVVGEKITKVRGKFRTKDAATSRAKQLIEHGGGTLKDK